MFTEDDLLPISALEHLSFCARQVALIHIERLWQDNILTAEGTLMHEKAHREEIESRGEIRIVRGLWLRSYRLGLYGKADAVEFLRIRNDRGGGVALQDVAGFWQPFPVEYKRGRLRSEESFEIQLCAQGLCLEEMLGVEVIKGALYYGKTHRRLEILLDEKLRKKTLDAAFRLHDLIASGVTPPALKQPKCKACSMVGLCLPGLLNRHKDVKDYLKKAFTNMEITS